MSDRAGIEKLLADLGIATEIIEHAPGHTVEEALPYWAGLDATHTKNLFLKGQKGDLWLLCAAADRRIDLKGVAQQVGAKRFSFANDELLFESLGVRQGAVSPLALINDREGKVRLILDASLLEAKRLAFHPLVNTATVALNSRDLISLLTALDHPPEVLTLAEPPAN
jgi:Ala-tRNA(Pro) deacylase